MYADSIDDRKLELISRTALAAYLRAQGWTKVDEWSNRASVFGKAGETHRIWVPVRETFADYVEHIMRSIQILAEVERRGVGQVFYDLIASESDKIALTTLESPLRSTLRLHDASHLLSGTYRLLSSAARAAEKPRPAFRGTASHRVTTYLDDVEPAPLGFDVFGLTIYSPLASRAGQQQLSADFTQVPFARRAVAGLVHSAKAVAAATARARDADTLDAFEHAVEQGVSSNLCASLADLTAQAADFGAGLDIDVEWARVGPPAASRRATASFSKHDLGVLQAARDHLRQSASFDDEHLVADVVRLEREPQEFDGRALLLADLDDRSRRFEVEFPPDDYEAVIRAFRERLRVELDGDIRPLGRTYEILHPRNLRVITN